MEWVQGLCVAVDSHQKKTWRFDWDDDGSGPGSGFLAGGATILTHVVVVEAPAVLVGSVHNNTTVTASFDFTACTPGTTIEATCLITFDSAIAGLTDQMQVEVKFYVES